VLSPTLTPWLAEQVGWSVALGFAACVALLGGLIWSKIKPGERAAVQGKVLCR
jgi:MFS transporter, ACS family, glucarate transporter